ncbi:restriction endonuclease [Hymenobacter actinosclerus]|uniref:Restriction system protein n=1 Tax=Hymenobacter actinosclerus TaxID=82805 RepID=A0A1I0FC59_9BACT|nr:restriction endonuclease [Hymenobacter actinosclerus]SET54931.1 restriction system protein [Hymenobacter actinosclerus]
MPIPDFQALLLPVLTLASDNAEHTIAGSANHLADTLQLSEADREAVYESGSGLIFRDRISWARSYLKMAGLLESTRRGYLRITPRGQQLLSEAPTAINLALLRQRYPDFREKLEENSRTSVAKSSAIAPAAQVSDASPRDVLNTAFQQWDNALKQDLLERMQQLPWQAFERLVVDLLVRMGYGGSFAEAGEAFQRGSDGGLDGVIKADRLGFDKLYVQAKRWQNGSTVGRPDVQAFVGALLDKGSTKGAFITTAKFSAEARGYKPANINLVLIDGQELAQLMIDYSVGVSTETTILLKRLDNDYFDQEL